MVAASDGPTVTHHGGIQLLVLTTLMVFVAALMPAGAVLAEPSHKAELLDQTIDLGLPQSGVVGDVVVLEGTASSGLPLSYEAKPPKRCTIDDGTLRLEAPGTCKVTAGQPGDDTYAPATAKAELKIEPAAGEDPAAQPAVKTEPKRQKPKTQKSKAEPKAQKPRAQGSKAEPKAKRDAPSGASAAAAGADKSTSDQRADGASSTVVVERTRDATPPAATSTEPLAEQPLIIPPAARKEGDLGTTPLSFTAACDPAHKTEVRFTYLTESGTATEGLDYKQTKGTVTIPVGQSSGSFAVDIIGDTLDEPDEVFVIHIADVIGAGYSGEVVTATILDDDRTLTMDDQALDEGPAGVTSLPLVFRLSKSLPDPVTFDYRIGVDGDTASGGGDPGTDYVSKSGSITIPPYTTYYDELEVTIWGDSTFELDEYFHICIDNVVGATPDRSCARVTIRNDDDPPVLTVGGDVVLEPDSGTVTMDFPVSLSKSSSLPVSFSWSTFDDTSLGFDATAGEDYYYASGTVTIPAGQTTMPAGTIQVTIIGDDVDEPYEHIGIQISSPVNATHDGAPVTGIIRNDDMPLAYFDTFDCVEALCATQPAGMQVRLSAPAYQDVIVSYTTSGGGATPGLDYLPVIEPAYVVIPAGDTLSAIETFTVYDDALDEGPKEMFFIEIGSISGARNGDRVDPFIFIWDDDDPPTLIVHDAAVSEGDAGITVLPFAIYLSTASGRTVTYDYEIVPVSATAGVDYRDMEPGTFTIDPETGGQPLTVDIFGDTVIEPDETFQVVISNVTNAVYDTADNPLTGTILDDDGSPPPDTTAPSVSPPRVDFARGSQLSRTTTPIPLVAAFGASDPSGISRTRLQHRINTRAFSDVPLASASAVQARLRISQKSWLVHRFRSQATDGLGNPSGWATAPAMKVTALQDGNRMIKQKGRWWTKRASAYFGRSVRATAQRGAKAKLTIVATDLAIVSTKGPNRGKAKVLLDGKRVATIDLYAPRTRARTIVWAASLPGATKHTLALEVLGAKNPKSKGKRVDLDAFLALKRQ